MIRAFAGALLASAAGILPASAAVVSVPVSAVPLSATVFFGAPTAAPIAAAPSPTASAPSFAPALRVAVLAFSAPAPLAPSAVPAAAPAVSAAGTIGSAAAVAPGSRMAPAEAAPIAASAGSPEQESAAARETFDGSRGAATVAAQAPLGWGLKTAREEHAPWLAAVVRVLASTRTGRRVLRDVDAMAAREGRGLLIDVNAISNNGEFRYDSDLLVMDSGHLKRDPRQSAPIMAHELQHVLQRRLQLPVDALELEVESYTVENQVWSELGVEPDGRSFARQARKRILKDADGFVAWLQREYKKNISLHGSSLDAYSAELSRRLAAAEKKDAALRRKRAAVERVMRSMRDNGMSEAAVEAHRQEELEPLDRRLRDNATEMGWLERDLRLLADHEGRRRFHDYSRGVIRRARALSSRAG